MASLRSSAASKTGSQLGVNHGTIRHRVDVEQDNDDFRRELQKMGVGLREEIQGLRVKLQHLEKLVGEDSDTILLSAGAPSSAGFFRFRTCVVLFFLIFLNVAGSAILGIYWAIRFDKMGDGFTAAGWLVAIGTLLLAGPIAYHYPRCSCWKTKDNPYMGRVNTLE
ncbi:hypothetical protein N7520_011074 [Penicillium odoratum]|uniref:uncharacterized protein n=1 Tax=Penicillium odoratum TaxID=1167516 RepID=UPI0025485463|nr:uncharacterized protein N7520_011074 [Penicillium odoratum]KAJ5745892.1 hypothetical protein N7520_011074 [Penicillium odoratum]